jgi:hypothetical protein
MMRITYIATTILAAANIVSAGSPQDVSRSIDVQVDARMQAAGVTAGPLAGDAEFLRRVYLDIAGRIPSWQEARRFLDDASPNKRRDLVEALLKDPRYVEHFANVWRSLLLPEQAADPFVNRGSFDVWMRRQLFDNVPYDRWVRGLLTVPFAAERVRTKPTMKRDEPAADPSSGSPEAYYLAKDAKPENLAAASARVFLGVRIECAQCHDHPSGHWTRQQFWAYAAFFAGLSREREGGGIRELFDKREITIPGGNQAIEAEFLDGNLPQWKFNVGSRVTLANWVTAPDNPYFAKAAANRLWAHFFGYGLVEPEDDLRADNPASHPALLEDLARQFVATGYDTKSLIRAIVLSDAYQRTSAIDASTKPPTGQQRLFDRMAIKRMSPEQLFDSLAQATGYREPAAPRNDLPVVYRGGARSEFLALFASAAAPRTDAQLSIPQALALMNGQLTAGALTGQNDLVTMLARSAGLDGLLGAKATFFAEIADNPKLDPKGKIEALYLATLSRKPSDSELGLLAKRNSRRDLADLLWALLNCTEFTVNR